MGKVEGDWLGRWGLEGGPDSDLLPIPWHNLQYHPTQPGTLDKDPAWRQSIRPMKYNWRPCLDRQPGQPPHQQHSASEPAAYQITKPSMRTYVTSEQNLIIQHNLRPQTTMKPCLLPLLNTQSIQLHPLVKEHSSRHHSARRDCRALTAVLNHRIQPGALL